MKQFTGKILSSRVLAADYHKIEFTWNKAAGAPQPGQFFTVRVSGGTAPLLRRPLAFSAFNAEKQTASMIFQKRGRGTEILAAMETGEPLDVIGPLGKPFPMPDKKQKALLVAGGIGLGPVLFLASRLSGAKLVFGCRTKGLVPSSSAFAGLKPTICTVVCTDDGTAGFRGTAGDFLRSIENSVTGNTIIYACGPLPMLKACHELALRRGAPCFVSIEQVMACGVGACMGCAVKAVDGGYKRACTEGPVFNSRELQWE
jgi:dihydroorotate dehydrogenase electron transfer subunit